MKTVRSVFVLATLLQSCAYAATASRELVHPFPPGGPAEVVGATRASRTLRAMQRYAAPAFTDVLAMHVAQTLREDRSEPVTVTRQHRRGGSAAALAVASSPPDGRTLLLATVPATPVRAQAGIPERVERIAAVGRMPYVWVSQSGTHDLAGLLRGGTTRLLVGHPGERTAAYRPLARLRSDPVIALEPVAYNGGIAALNALAGAQVAAALVPLPAVLPYASGQIRFLAIADRERYASLPDVPTTREAGLQDAEAVVAFAVFAPPATPAALVRPVAAALSRVAETPGARALFLDYGVRLEYSAAGR
ncbi:MAG TPA: tripartite tricarboxylate transporter substrate-binding protein [Burkholderiales bacterium]|nr:tripartite tricarboxylate transporter substrate-binding protein [Burkholderiales bacterium]